MFNWFRSIRKLWRAYSGKCPHCGKRLVQKNKKITRPTRTGRIQRFFRQCPDAHYAIEYISKNQVIVHDENGEQIELLFSRNFKVLKNNDEPAD